MSYTPTPPQSNPGYYPPPNSEYRASPITTMFPESTPPPPPPPKSLGAEATPTSQGPIPPHRPSSEASWQHQTAYDQQSQPHYGPQPSTPQTNPHQQQQHPIPQQTQPPPLPEEGWVPDILLDKSKAELETLLQRPHLLASLLHAPRTIHPSLAHSDAALQAALARNAALASHLSGLHAALQGRRGAVSTQLHSVRALEQAWKVKQAELERALEAFGPRVLHQRLVASIGEQEAVCRGVEESFLEGEGHAGDRETSEWVKRVRDGRKVVALRRERRGRWDEGRVGGWR